MWRLLCVSRKLNEFDPIVDCLFPSLLFELGMDDDPLQNLSLLDYVVESSLALGGKIDGTGCAAGKSVRGYELPTYIRPKGVF